MCLITIIICVRDAPLIVARIVRKIDGAVALGNMSFHLCSICRYMICYWRQVMQIGAPRDYRVVPWGTGKVVLTKSCHCVKFYQL